MGSSEGTCIYDKPGLGLSSADGANTAAVRWRAHSHSPLRMMTRAAPSPACCWLNRAPPPALVSNHRRMTLERPHVCEAGCRRIHRFFLS